MNCVASDPLFLKGSVGSFWSCGWKRSWWMAKLLVFSVLQWEHIQSCEKTTCVCSGVWWEQSAHPDFHVCPVCDETCILVTKEAYFPLCRIGRVRTYSPQKPPHQAAQISRTKSFATTRLLQKVDFCSDSGLWTGAPVMTIDCCGLGGSVSSSYREVLIHHNCLLSDSGKYF